MCGRYASFRQAEALAEAFDVDEVTQAAAEVRPSFNIAPTRTVRVVVDREIPSSDDDGIDAPAAGLPPTRIRELHAARWGLVPPWASDVSIGARLINARSETAAQKRSFAPSLRARRCVIPADGYYEWKTGSRGKTPYFIHRGDAGPLALAGLYAFWRDPEREPDSPARWLLTTTILTRAARPALAPIHDREPAILPPEAVDAWLDPRVTDVTQALEMLTPPGPELAFHEVSSRVNTVAEDVAALIEPSRR